jgi:hypothetical protein
MTDHETQTRRIQEADRRLDALKFSGPNRPAARQAMVLQIESEETAAADTAKAAAEAREERDRIAAVVKAGIDTGRPLQALRLALAGPVTAVQAKEILATLPRDQEQPPEALAIGAPATDGTAAALAERQRIATIFADPAATGRFRHAAALALDGRFMPAPVILGIMVSFTPDPVAPPIPSIEERAAGMAEFGSDVNGGFMSGQDRIAEGWKKAVARANEMIGVRAAGPSAGQPAPATNVPSWI